MGGRDDPPCSVPLFCLVVRLAADRLMDVREEVQTAMNTTGPPHQKTRANDFSTLFEKAATDVKQRCPCPLLLTSAVANVSAHGCLLTH